MSLPLASTSGSMNGVDVVSDIVAVFFLAVVASVSIDDVVEADVGFTVVVDVVDVVVVLVVVVLEVVRVVVVVEVVVDVDVVVKGFEVVIFESGSSKSMTSTATVVAGGSLSYESYGS